VFQALGGAGDAVVFGVEEIGEVAIGHLATLPSAPSPIRRGFLPRSADRLGRFSPRCAGVSPGLTGAAQAVTASDVDRRVDVPVQSPANEAGSSRGGRSLSIARRGQIGPLLYCTEGVAPAAPLHAAPLRSRVAGVFIGVCVPLPAMPAHTALLILPARLVLPRLSALSCCHPAEPTGAAAATTALRGEGGGRAKGPLRRSKREPCPPPSVWGAYV